MGAGDTCTLRPGLRDEAAAAEGEEDAFLDEEEEDAVKLLRCEAAGVEGGEARADVEDLVAGAGEPRREAWRRARVFSIGLRGMGGSERRGVSAT